jgi:hypothetical protein
VACDPVTYSGVDASKWACAKDIASREYGIPIKSDHGQASDLGFTVKWLYEVGDQTLEIQCTEKPFIFDCDTVNNRIKAAADECGLTAA